jgi:hypothetical protein
VTVRTVSVGGENWRYAPDVPPPSVAERSQAILQAQLLDEVLNAPPAPPVAATTTVKGAVARLAAGGRAGVIGRPALAFFAPAIANAPLDLTVLAQGFLPLELTAKVGAQPGYPNAFAPKDLGTVALHRNPVRIMGRLISRATGPLNGGTVTVTGIWPVLQRPPGAPAAPNGMPAFAGLYADRAAGSIRRRNFTPAALAQTLQRPGSPGDSELRLSDSQGLAVGQVLGIDWGDPERLELIGIAALNPGSTADQPASVTLDHQLRREHAEQSPAARAVPSGGAGPTNAITRPARRGDATVWTAGLAGIGAATTAIQISGAPAPDEYQPTTTYAADSGLEGDYVLPPIHRIATLELTATHPTKSPLVRQVSLIWNASVQTVDFLFP